MPLPLPYAYLVCLDFNTPEGNYAPLLGEVTKSFAWWRYLKNTWIVLRYETLVELQAKLVPLIFVNDRLLIVPAKGPAAGYLPADAWKWINEKVPREW